MVYIDYARQFTGATGGGVTTAARQVVRQLQKAGADLAGGRAASSRGGGAKPRKRQGQSGAAAAGDGAVGHWVVEPGQAKVRVRVKGEGAIRRTLLRAGHTAQCVGSPFGLRVLRTGQLGDAAALPWAPARAHPPSQLTHQPTPLPWDPGTRAGVHQCAGREVLWPAGLP